MNKEFLTGLYVGSANFRTSCRKLERQEDRAAALKAYRISLVFLFCDNRTLTGYYKKEICHLFANFLIRNISRYY